jgi:hypothetical protein
LGRSSSASPAASPSLRSRPRSPVIGTVGGFQFILQDGGRNTFGDIDRVAHTIVGASRGPGSGLTA